MKELIMEIEKVPLRLTLVAENILRLQVDPTGMFSDEPSLPPTETIPTGGDETVATGGRGQHFKTPILAQQVVEKSFDWDEITNQLTTEKMRFTFDIAAQKLTVQFAKYVPLSLQLPAFSFSGFQLRVASQADEYFFGGGTQNGRYSLKGQKIKIENQNDWTDGGVASPNPFYFSTNGYGLLFHTFAPGEYDFSDPRQILLQHQSEKLDCFLIFGDPATVIHGYHQLTGSPQLNPLYSYYPAHLNAYNRDYWVEVTADSAGAVLFPDHKYYKEYQPLNPKSFNLKRPGKISVGQLNLVPNVPGNGQVDFVEQQPNGQPTHIFRESLNGEENYQFSARAVIDRYHKYDLPLGWFLPNDGYGAGYGQTETLAGDLANLRRFTDYATKQGVTTGLWTQEQLVPVDPQSPEKNERDLQQEISVGGISALKTDVAWIGAGYTFGLNAIAKVHQIMRKYSSTRPFIVTLDGWAGTQRYASIWTGDQTGSDWQNIKFHIPTYLSTGLSGNPNVGSDIDGIFAGDNPVIQTRDLQWKSFTPIQLIMDGWGSHSKDLGSQFGEPYLAINRFYLHLKTSLLSYFYSLAAEAMSTGVPLVRPTFWSEAKAFTYGSSLDQQFLLGDFLLIAPIFENYQLDEAGNDLRSSLYLPDPNCEWYEFFTGQRYVGGQTLADFPAPLWKLPVFVKAGSILPLLTATNQPREIDFRNQTLRIYPGPASSFTLYEDDGYSNDYLTGAWLRQTITQQTTEDQTTITIQAATGKFVEQRPDCNWQLAVLCDKALQEVRLNGKKFVDWQISPLQMTITPTHQTICGRFLQLALGECPRRQKLVLELIYAT